MHFVASRGQTAEVIVQKTKATTRWQVVPNGDPHRDHSMITRPVVSPPRMLSPVIVKRVVRSSRRRVATAVRRFPRRNYPICDDLAAWVERYPGAERWVLDSSFITTRPPPRTIEDSVDPSFEALYSFPVPERALVKVPNARIRSVKAPWYEDLALILLPTGEFVGELVALTPAGRRSVLRRAPSYYERLPSRPVEKEGNYYAFLGVGSMHYYHWSHDLIMAPSVNIG